MLNGGTHLKHQQIHEENLCIIDQQEVGVHIPTGAAGLHNAIHVGADVIFSGEFEDPESICLALEAASNDQLVLVDLPYGGGIGGTFSIFDFILHKFQAQRREIVRSMLGKSLRAVVSQRLFPKSGGSGFVGSRKHRCSPSRKAG